MGVRQRAWPLVALGALAGMAGCRATPSAALTPDDLRVDAVWLGLVRDDLPAAERAADLVESVDFRERARLDLIAARQGRAAALCTSLDAGSWLAARYDASDDVALERLRLLRQATSTRPAVWLEQARRSPSAGQRLSAARHAAGLAPGSAEARAVVGETLLAQQQHEDVEELLGGEVPPTARLRLLLRRQQSFTGRGQAATEGLLADLQAGLATPSSLALLEEQLARVPRRALEEQTLALLEAERHHAVDSPDRVPLVSGARMQRSADRLLASLLARAGRPDEAAALLVALPVRMPADDELLAACRERAGLATPAAAAGDEPPSLERRIANDRERVTSIALRERRLADEWDLEARASYDDADAGHGSGLDAFLRRLDEAAVPLPGSPPLRHLPREHFGPFGVFGTLLDVQPLREALPDALLLGGEALTQPAELTWFDRVASERIELPGALGSYEQSEVRRVRVRGYVASRGAAIAGTGLGRTVYLDLDAIERDERQGLLSPVGPGCGPLPAQGTEERLSLAEPLDVVSRLVQASRAEAGDRYEALLLEALALHERQHIVDFQTFVAGGTGSALWTLFGAGLLPSSVRAAIERRAQLQAMRDATDPRIPLAHALAELPVDDSSPGDEHSRGYASLVRDFLAVLDRGDWPGAASLESYGIRRDAVLVQQLQRLPPETVRAIARSIAD